MATKIISNKTGKAFDDLVYDGYQGGSAYFTNTISIPVDGYQAYADSVNLGFGQLIDDAVYLKTNKFGVEGGTFNIASQLEIDKTSGSKLVLGSNFTVGQTGTSNSIGYAPGSASLKPNGNAFIGNRISIAGGTGATNQKYEIPAVPENFLISGTPMIKIGLKQFGNNDYDLTSVGGKIFTISKYNTLTEQSAVYIMLYNNQTDYDNLNFDSGYDQRVQILFGAVGFHSVTYMYLNTGTLNLGRIVPISYSVYPSATIDAQMYARLWVY